jgi:hypothetical protein
VKILFSGVVDPVKRQGMKWFLFRALVLGFLCFGASAFAQSPPINDDFENRIILSGSSVTFTGTLANATLQSREEPALYGPANISSSVWWSWTAPATGTTTLDVLDYSTNTFKRGGMEIWTGTDFWTNFTSVGSVGFYTGRHPFLTFAATAGTTYHLRVLGTNYGDFTLRITQTNTPVIMVQPAGRTVATNGSTYLGVVVAGVHPLLYQWHFNGVDLPGETAPILSLDHLTTDQSGSYSVMVSNGNGGTVSDVAVLKVADTGDAPRFVAVGSSEWLVDFKILGDPGRIRRIESSTNLTNWFEETGFPDEFIYNGTDRFSVPKTLEPKFYRAIFYRPSNEICINNLRKIRFAKEIWSLEYKVSPIAVPAIANIAPYFKGGVPFCPLDSAGFPKISYELNDESTNPQCKISIYHVLEDSEY